MDARDAGENPITWGGMGALPYILWQHTLEIGSGGDPRPVFP
jgi:hypothetical protein